MIIRARHGAVLVSGEGMDRSLPEAISRHCQDEVRAVVGPVDGVESVEVALSPGLSMPLE